MFHVPLTPPDRDLCPFVLRRSAHAKRNPQPANIISFGIIIIIILLEIIIIITARAHVGGHTELREPLQRVRDVDVDDVMSMCGKIMCGWLLEEGVVKVIIMICLATKW